MIANTFDGDPCVKCGSTLRYALGGDCATCSRTRSAKRATTEPPELHSWNNMWQRCTNPKVHNYHRYGGRGIAIDPDWADSDIFLRDMGSRPSAQHSLERIDNNGPYCKANCKWATRTEQYNNRTHCATCTCVVR